MTRSRLLLSGAMLLMLTEATYAQVATTRVPSVRAIGEATITATPDLAKLSFSVETRGATAQEASAANATQTTGLLAALRSAIGPGADIRTINYSINPIYSYPSGSAPVLTGYAATNTVEVSLTDLSIAGKVLDTGTQGGATRVTTLSFTLRDPEPVRLRALRQAATQARSHAEAMVTGLGLRLGSIIGIDEGGTPPRVISSDRTTAVGAPTTPIEPGNVSVTATLVMEIEIVR
jgi:uncharacterized protein YggE